MTARTKKQGTQTSSFGSPGRINHDATTFYNSKLYDNLPREERDGFVEQEIDKRFLNKIFCQTSENMVELPDNSIHLMVTSPPYNVGKDYDEDFTLDEYLQFLKRVWKEVFRVLAPGGRACINIANLGRKPYIPIHSFIINDMLELGFLMRGEIIWNKASSSSPSTAWGSWLSAANPTLRDIHEYILVFSKAIPGRKDKQQQASTDNPILRDVHEYILVFSKAIFGRKNKQPKINTVSKEEFLEFTKSVWTFSAEPAKKVGHPAPFPVELPYRLIQLYTFKDDVVLDPFMGSGQTAIAAVKTERHYIGYEIDQQYLKLAERRIREFTVSFKSQKAFEF